VYVFLLGFKNEIRARVQERAVLGSETMRRDAWACTRRGWGAESECGLARREAFEMRARPVALLGRMRT
jgi:hypothetical protein